MNDADLSDTVSSSVTAVVASGATTGLRLTSAAAGHAERDAGSDRGQSDERNNLGWTFNSTPQAFDYLAVGESLTLTYTVQSTDDNAASDTRP